MQANFPSFFWSLLQHIQKLSSGVEEYDEDVIGKRMLDGNARPRRRERRERDERSGSAGKRHLPMRKRVLAPSSPNGSLARLGLLFGSLGASVFFDWRIRPEKRDFDHNTKRLFM